MNTTNNVLLSPSATPEVLSHGADLAKVKPGNERRGDRNTEDATHQNKEFDSILDKQLKNKLSEDSSKQVNQESPNAKSDLKYDELEEKPELANNSSFVAKTDSAESLINVEAAANQALEQPSLPNVTAEKPILNQTISNQHVSATEENRSKLQAGNAAKEAAINATEQKMETVILNTDPALNDTARLIAKPSTTPKVNTTSIEKLLNNQSTTNSSLLAGPLETSKDDDMHNNRPALNATLISAADSEQVRKSGNLAPTSGKNLPGDLPFLSNNITDLINKAVAQSQLSLNNAAINLSQNLEPQTTPQASVSETSPLNFSNLSTVDKSSLTNTANSLNSTANTSFSLQQPAGSPEWNRQLGDKIRFMARVNISSAELQLHPAELGSIEIKISLEDDQARVNFVTANSSAKEVIEASLPKLRDLLANTGLQLEQSDVSQKDVSENNSYSQQKNNNPSSSNDDSVLANMDASLLVKQNNNSLYDHYV